jgi:hypothetical protein
MSRIDDTFKQIPGRLMADWGSDITYVKTSTPRNYDPTTGAVNGADVEVTVRAVISNISSREQEGLYQTTDLSILIGNEELGTYFPTEADRIRYPQAGVTREAKIINVRSYRGDNPLFHQLIVRPQ